MKFINIVLLSIVICLIMAVAVPASVAAESEGFDGLIEPYMVVKVGSAVRGILDVIKVDRGDMVKEGDVLATLESGVERATASLARAKAEMEAIIKAKREALEFAKRKQKRVEELYQRKVVPLEEWDKVETETSLAEFGLAESLENRRLAQLEYEQAVAAVKRMEIRSPLTGIVVERFLHPGEYVEDQPILELAQIDPLHVEVILPVEKYGSIRSGMRASVIPEVPVAGVYYAKVTIVDKVIDAASGTFGVRLTLPNPDYRLPSGLKCKVVFLDK